MAVLEIGLFLGFLNFMSGKKASKEQLKLMQDQYKVQLEQAKEQERKMRERVKQTSDYANINESIANFQEAAGAAEQGFNRLSAQRAQALEDKYVGKRTHDVDKLFSGGVPGSGGERARTIALAVANRKDDMLNKSIYDPGSKTAARFTQAPSGVAGPWAGAYNKAVHSSADSIKKEMVKRGHHLSQLGRLQEIDKQDQIGTSALNVSDWEQERMTEALKSDTRMGQEALDAEKRKVAADIGKKQADITRGYNTGERIFAAPDPSAYNKAAARADLIGGISSIFNTGVSSGYIPVK